MPAPKGNQFWLQRTKHGRDKIFSSPEILWQAACEYFQWVQDNPLPEEKVFHTNGLITKTTVNKMRAMTKEGLYLFLDISHTTWDRYKDREDFSEITWKIEEVIKSQKFAGAAADLLNANIIARDLGLVDKQERESKVTVIELDSQLKDDDD